MSRIKTIYSTLLDYDYNNIFNENNTQWDNDGDGHYELTYNEDTVIEAIAEEVAEEVEANDNEFDFILNTLKSDYEVMKRLEEAFDAYREASLDLIEYEKQVHADYMDYIHS